MVVDVVVVIDVPVVVDGDVIVDALVVMGVDRDGDGDDTVDGDVSNREVILAGQPAAR